MLARLLGEPFGGGEPLCGLAAAGSCRARLGFLDARGRHLQLLRELEDVPSGLILLLADPGPELLELCLERLANLDLALRFLLRSFELLLGGSTAGGGRLLPLTEAPLLRFGFRRRRLAQESGRRAGRGGRPGMRARASTLDGESPREQQHRDQKEENGSGGEPELDQVPWLLGCSDERCVPLIHGHGPAGLPPGALEPHVGVEELDRRGPRGDRNAIRSGDARRRAARGAPDRIGVAGLQSRSIRGVR